jgi:hypothetical protein
MAHWRTYLDSDVIRYVDLDGRDHVVQIERVVRGKVTGAGGKSSGKAMIHLKGRTKPIGCGAEMLTQLANHFGNEVKEWSGKWVTLWPDPSVKYGGARVGGVRVRDKLPDDAAIALALKQAEEAKKAQAAAESAQGKQAAHG